MSAYANSEGVIRNSGKEDAWIHQNRSRIEKAVSPLAFFRIICRPVRSGVSGDVNRIPVTSGDIRNLREIKKGTCSRRNPVPEPLHQCNHFQDLLFLLVGESAPFLDETAHPHDLHALLLA